ncbi:bifunctional phosphoribosyl-AMP cyclohydrolase/phosphoribosyl-ATP diphosphatase HisIE [Ferruginibacter sp. HRS2-29]|uniref:bifunctional phosphoribosyl-AMP cyclohydrolase/phosphoribosyl-ATP diphosphatase HisIE n=1 Tax=Ferruginibacter sp. HRS2-29 TaxID=2487334 RepID=UPI0020CF0D2A|nr:bifunctional phosphoribosyl-AMP cyclohydrolase/phosphoribosyl-ATP diphosphatase HisIE [Ferruginibacter sp. HRS2-29]MCP9749867.1 bifunctional phosphoribosyl-AMP cyclohydrolase/phosphoribosyl-ATP diphosphatase HisIE [Ferruginibacter sp. HRS2-29]
MQIDFKKYTDGLAPAIIQDAVTLKVLMLGFMNQEALDKTTELRLVTFFSRSKNRLWTKGEESGNFLHVNEISVDCDNDSLLIKVRPAGPVCHKGTDTCWGEKNVAQSFIPALESIITQRKNEAAETSYTSSLFKKGINKIAQKVGEEAVELVIEAKDDNDELFKNEAADLLFHYLILLQAKGMTMNEIEGVLKQRHEQKK